VTRVMQMIREEQSDPYLDALAVKTVADGSDPAASSLG